MNDSELVQGLRRHDPAARQWLCDCCLPSLWRFVFSRVNGDLHLAEDITHETVLAMLIAIESNPRGAGEIVNPAGWLRTVAQRRITDHFRAAARVQHLLQEPPRPEAKTADQDASQQHELQEIRAEVRHALETLPDQYRLALEWKYLDQLSVREIATRWSITEKAVESILFRARRQFRDQLQQRSDTEPGCNGRRWHTIESQAEPSIEHDPAQKSL